MRPCSSTSSADGIPIDKSEDEEEEEYAEEDEDTPAMPKGRNKQLTVGYKGDRSYVVRDDKIGVFSHTGQNQVKYYASISNVATPKGKVFSPKHVGYILCPWQCMH